jgi:hypothetical protein
MDLIPASLPGIRTGSCGFQMGHPHLAMRSMGQRDMGQRDLR